MLYLGKSWLPCCTTPMVQKEEKRKQNDSEDTGQKSKKTKEAFIYGNYRYYYGYRVLITWIFCTIFLLLNLWLNFLIYIGSLIKIQNKILGCWPSRKSGLKEKTAWISVAIRDSLPFKSVPTYFILFIHCFLSYSTYFL